MRFDLFATPIWQFEPNPNIDLDGLVTAIHDLRAADPDGNKISNIGGWQSQMYLNKEDAFSGLAAHIIAKGEVALEEWGLGLGGLSPHMNTMWANVNSGADHNFTHDHWAFPVPHYNLLSGAFYVRADENSGEIKFVDERVASKYVILAPFIKRPNHLSADMFQIKPKRGTLVMFPSWLRHSVNPSKSDAERISISFNLSVPREIMGRILNT